jgi:hypothetical protein
LSVSDLGARVCCQWISDDGMLQSNFAQFGPIQFSLAGAVGLLTTHLYIGYTRCALSVC